MNNEQNISEQINETVEELIKKLSGKGTSSNVKVMDNVLAFIGMQGGCGTSTLVANIATVLATKKNLQVLIIDMNILYPIQYTYFKCPMKREQADLVSFLLGKNEAGESIVTKNNISVLFSNNRNLLDYINCDSDLASNNLSGLIDRIKYLFDLIIIDCPMDLSNDIVNTILFKSDTIYTVWSEGLSCIANANRFITNLGMMGIDNTKVKAIMNKRTSIQYGRTVFTDLGYELVGVIPFDISVMECDLQSRIYYEKGESRDKNAQEIIFRLDDLTDIILKNGGYIETKKDKKNKSGQTD